MQKPSHDNLIIFDKVLADAGSKLFNYEYISCITSTLRHVVYLSLI